LGKEVSIRAQKGAEGKRRAQKGKEGKRRAQKGAEGKKRVVSSHCSHCSRSKLCSLSSLQCRKELYFLKWESYLITVPKQALIIKLRQERNR
jgi:hypothetical protein